MDWGRVVSIKTGCTRNNVDIYVLGMLVLLRCMVNVWFMCKLTCKV